MSSKILTFSLFESMLAVIFGLMAIYFSLKFIEKFIVKAKLKDIAQSQNVPLAIFTGALIFCFLQLTMISILPSINYLQAKVYEVPILEMSFYLFAFCVFLGGYIFSFILSATLLFLGTQIIFYTTKDIDEIKEIREGQNMSIAALLSFVLIALTLFIKPSLSNLLKSIVNFIG